jgi:ATP-dependent exoDNAse (exonuclease V) alpha subunit
VALEQAGALGPEAGLAALDQLHARGEILDLLDGRQTTRAHRALETRTLATAQALTDARVPAVNRELVQHEVGVLSQELAKVGASLSAEQEEAIRLGSSDRPLVVMVGQAGTGKSTALVGIARAHEQAGREIVVTSTGAQAAARLASELGQAGVAARGYSTVALRARVSSGRVSLGPSVTLLHDEAALASTREQSWLFGAARDGGARLIAVGDARQSQAVGAGGLWPRIEALAQQHGNRVELSRIVRARDRADRRDQALWRAGQHERSLSGYADRGRVIVEADQRRAEDRALDAAQADRAGGRQTLVVAETSNEQLDALNARAQAIRAQQGELGRDGVPMRGRPYALRQGDQIVVRAPIQHEQLGPVRNGTGGEVTKVDVDNAYATLRLGDGREGRFGQALLDAGQVRLAYVAHPFPSQGQTTDTTHVIAGPLSSAEGSYVALTRAREQTHVYGAADRLGLADGGHPREAVTALAEQLGRSEPEMPSISVPLAHEQRVEREHSYECGGGGREDLLRLRAERDALGALVRTYPTMVAQHIERLGEQADRSRESAEAAREQVDAARAALEGMGPFARRGAGGQQLRAQIARDEHRERLVREAERDARSEIERLRAGPDSPSRWEAENPYAREQLSAAKEAYAQAVEIEVDRALEQPGEHLQRVLGERPGEEREAHRDAWDAAARAIEHYRVAHDVADAERSALGAEPQVGRDGWEQHGDWRDAARAAVEAREQLGLTERELGPIEERAANIDGLMPESERERERDRDHGIEL